MSATTQRVPEVLATVDPRVLRRCLGRFATGVTVVTYRDGDGQVRGATVNSFTSVSLDPPLVLIALGRNTHACEAMAGRSFAINVLRADQRDVALQFAGRSCGDLNLNWSTAVGQEAPSLADAVAVFACRPWQRYDGGDHVLEVGQVIDFTARDGDPLMFADGRFISHGLPLLDGPIVLDRSGPPRVGWTGVAPRMHALAEH